MKTVTGCCKIWMIVFNLDSFKFQPSIALTFPLETDRTTWLRLAVNEHLDALFWHFTTSVFIAKVLFVNFVNDQCPHGNKKESVLVNFSPFLLIRSAQWTWNVLLPSIVYRIDFVQGRLKTCYFPEPFTGWIRIVILPTTSRNLEYRSTISQGRCLGNFFAQNCLKVKEICPIFGRQ